MLIIPIQLDSLIKGQEAARQANFNDFFQAAKAQTVQQQADLVSARLPGELAVAGVESDIARQAVQAVRDQGLVTSVAQSRAAATSADAAQRTLRAAYREAEAQELTPLIPQIVNYEGQTQVNTAANNLVTQRDVRPLQQAATVRNLQTAAELALQRTQLTQLQLQNQITAAENQATLLPLQADVKQAQLQSTQTLQPLQQTRDEAVLQASLSRANNQRAVNTVRQALVQLGPMLAGAGGNSGELPGIVGNLVSSGVLPPGSSITFDGRQHVVNTPAGRIPLHTWADSMRTAITPPSKQRTPKQDKRTTPPVVNTADITAATGALPQAPQQPAASGQMQPKVTFTPSMIATMREPGSAVYKDATRNVDTEIRQQNLSPASAERTAMIQREVERLIKVYTNGAN